MKSIGIPKRIVRVLVLFVPLLVSATRLAAQPVVTEVRQTSAGFRLMRDGQQHYIQGAGGPASLELLSAIGGNSTRTWGLDELESGRLDEAFENGLTVTVGIWLRHDLDYDDPVEVKEQIEKAVAGVKKYKSHPAIAIWGIGNETEGEGERVAVWKHIEQVAALVKREDPNHPTMAVLAELGAYKVQYLHHYCPSIDIVGVNAYGGAASIPRRYREAGGKKPYVLTEFGPRGPWEIGYTAIGSVNVELPQVKAATYREAYEAVLADRQLCLGSYAFVWGAKQEATPTWFGMLLADGRRTAAVDTMQELWTGEKPENLCPQVNSLQLSAKLVAPGAELTAKVEAFDPEGKSLRTSWVLSEDAKTFVTQGYHQDAPLELPKRFVEKNVTSARLRAPTRPGLYRLYCYVEDPEHSAAFANALFRVTVAE
ncbi:MAG: glycoside hydrolase family 2 TIM barrel-domain containing protein [Aureliella sp.]